MDPFFPQGKLFYVCGPGKHDLVFCSPSRSFCSSSGGFRFRSLAGGKTETPYLIGDGCSFRIGLALVPWCKYFFAMVLLAIVGSMILIPDVLLATYPSDILTRKLAATGMGFIVTFTSMSGIVATFVSGKIVDLFSSYGALFISFAVMAAAGTVLTLFIREKGISERTQETTS